MPTSKKQNLKIASLEEKLNRSLADYANLQKRIDSQRQLFATLASASVITKMLDILDDLTLTYHHLKNPGLKMVIDKFTAVLESEGLSSVSAKGQLFDPTTMDCVDTAPGKQDIVVEIQKPGYLLNSHIIRPAQVVVGTSQKTKK